ncbi:hypothetical protein YC2023_026770 [Brassica napus]
MEQRGLNRTVEEEQPVCKLEKKTETLAIAHGFQEDYSVTGIVSCSEDEDEKICLRMSSLEVEAKKNTVLT